MKRLTLAEPYSVKEIAAGLGFSAKLENRIRSNFGDPVSINDLKLITLVVFKKNLILLLGFLAQFQ